MVESATQREIAYRKIKGDIINRRWPAGTKLVERKVCKTLNLSRTPIREAFNHLEKEGLLEHVPKRGVFTKRFDKREVLEMYEAREGLEGIGARLAAGCATRDDLEKMEQVLKKMEAILKKGNGQAGETQVGEYNRADNEFHNLLVKASHNRILINLSSRCHMEVAEVPKKAASANAKKSGWTQVFKEHRHILDCLKSGNAVLSERNVRKHIARGKCKAERDL